MKKKNRYHRKGRIMDKKESSQPTAENPTPNKTPSSTSKWPLKNILLIGIPVLILIIVLICVAVHSHNQKMEQIEMTTMPTSSTTITTDTTYVDPYEEEWEKGEGFIDEDKETETRISSPQDTTDDPFSPAKIASANEKWNGE